MDSECSQTEVAYGVNSEVDSEGSQTGAGSVTTSAEALKIPAALAEISGGSATLKASLKSLGPTR